MKEQNFEGDDIFDVGSAIINLQSLGMCLKDVVLRLSGSKAREYLLEEMSQMIKFKTVHDFYYLHNKISWMMNMAERYGLDGEVMELLREIKIETNKIVQHIERESR